MTVVQQVVRLNAAHDAVGGLPPTAVGDLLRVLEPAVRSSTRMAFESRSSASGRRPTWLTESADIRLTDVAIQADGALLRFNAPRFIDAASILYQQTELFPSLPDGQLTGFDMLAGVLSRVSKDDADSDRYDRQLLRGITQFDAGLNGTFASMELLGADGRVTQRLDKTLIEHARNLRDRTPPPRPVRLVGTLDMVRASTGTLGLKLDDGTEIRCVLVDGDVTQAKRFFNQRVLVHGSAVYRASGRLLRIDADALEDGVNAASLWTRIPEPIRSALTPQQLNPGGPRRGGVEAFFGKWPGDETEDELLTALQAL